MSEKEEGGFSEQSMIYMIGVGDPLELLIPIVIQRDNAFTKFESPLFRGTTVLFANWYEICMCIHVCVCFAHSYRSQAFRGPVVVGGRRAQMLQNPG